MSARAGLVGVAVFLVAALAWGQQPSKKRGKHRRHPQLVAASAPAPEPEATPTVPEPPVAAQTELVPRPAPEETVVSASEAPASPARELPFVDVAVGGGMLHRTFDYTDDIFHALDSYALKAAASFEADAEVYPGALVGPGWLANVGLVGRYNVEPGLASIDSAGDRLTTVSDAWEVGPKVRGRIGLAELFGSATWSRQRFSVQIPPGATSVPVIPGVAYSAVRGDAGARLAITDLVTVLADAAYLQVLGSGAVSSAYFPRLAVAGVEGRLGVAIRIGGPFEARAWADYRRYFFSMNPQPGDPYVAGGALDQYLTLTGAVAARW